MSGEEAEVTALVVLVGHGGFPQGVLDGAELIMGPLDAVHAVGLRPDQEPEAVVEEVRRLMAARTSSGPVLLLVDLFGGSPGNAVAAGLLREPGVAMVTGLNLPMVLEVVNRRRKAGADIAALASYAVAAGTAGVVDVGAKLRS